MWKDIILIAKSSAFLYKRGKHFSKQHKGSHTVILINYDVVVIFLKLICIFKQLF